MTALPPQLTDAERRRIARDLRESEWLARLYRHNILTARAVRGLQNEGAAEFDRLVTKPLLRETAAALATVDRSGGQVLPDLDPGMRSLAHRIDGIANAAHGPMVRLTREQMRQIGQSETKWVQGAAARVLDIPVRDAPADAAVQRTWFLGAKVEDWYGSLLQRDVGEKARRWIARGIADGTSTEDILRGLRGTRSVTGLLEQSERHVETLIRTAATHAATQARQASFRALGLERYRWVATLDDRSCPVCGELDGQVFEVGKGPLPPVHPNCRCTDVPDFGGDPDGTRASTDGQVPARTTFEEWLETRSAAEQDEVLGVTRGKAFRAGKIGLADLVGPGLRPLTLEELREMDRI